MSAERESIETIKAMLADRVAEVAMHYAPGGTVSGLNWHARCPWRADHKPGSFMIAVAGSRRGIAIDFAESDKGMNLLEFIRRCLGTDIVGAIKEARRFLGLDDASPEARAEFERRAREIERRRQDEERRRAEDLVKHRKQAKAIWLDAKPLQKGDPAWSYFAARGLDLDALPGRPPGAIRFCPDLYLSEDQGKHPGVVSGIVRPDNGQFLAIHRIYLEQAGGAWRKLSTVENPKKVWPAYWGGLVPVWRGSRDLSITKLDTDKQGPLYLTEGIEDALAIALAKPDRVTAAAVAVANLHNLDFPAAVRSIVLGRDNDDKPAAVAATDKAIDEATRRWIEEGRAVRIWRAPVGKDANDVIRGEGRPRLSAGDSPAGRSAGGVAA